jgi:phosphohistidine phosphatase
MRLMLLRHAKSERAAPGQRDRDRGLTARGRDDSARMGTYMVQHGLLADRALVSPAVRTRETWKRLAPELPVEPPVDHEERLYEGHVDAIVAAIQQADRAAAALLVVGHNPSLHETAHLLIGSGDVEARERLEEGLPTAGLIVIDFAVSDWSGVHPEGGRLERFVTPKLIKAAID